MSLRYWKGYSISKVGVWIKSTPIWSLLISSVFEPNSPLRVFIGASVYFVVFPQLVLSSAAGAEVIGSLIIDFHEGNLRTWAFEMERVLSSTQSKDLTKSTGVLPPSKNAGWHSAFALSSQMLKGESKTNQNQHVLSSDYLKRLGFF